VQSVALHRAESLLNRCNVRLHSDGFITPSVAFLLPIFSRKLLILLYLFDSRRSVDLAAARHPDNKKRTQKRFRISECGFRISRVDRFFVCEATHNLLQTKSEIRIPKSEIALWFA
jgi:hypothetical protein